MRHEAAPTPGGAPARIVCKATPLAVRAALNEARIRWRSGDIPDTICDTAEQVLAEVLNNIVEHAQAGHADGTVEFAATRLSDGMVFEVRDDGLPMPGGRLPTGDPAELGTKAGSLPEGGFGWFMIRSLTEDLRYERRGGWNYLEFRIA